MTKVHQGVRQVRTCCSSAPVIGGWNCDTTSTRTMWTNLLPLFNHGGKPLLSLHRMSCAGAETTQHQQKTTDTLISLMSERLSLIDAVRAVLVDSESALHFQQHLESDERIRMIRYKTCNAPSNVEEAISELVGISLPARSIASRVRPQPEASGETDLHPDAEKLCPKTWDSFAGCPEL